VAANKYFEKATTTQQQEIKERKPKSKQNTQPEEESKKHGEKAKRKVGFFFFRKFGIIWAERCAHCIYRCFSAAAVWCKIESGLL
jgi:hypothetical protein